MSKYNVVDLFAGVGGLSYGFSQLGEFEIIMANELQKDISIAYKLNHPGVNMINCDIASLTEEVIRKAIGNHTIDVVVGGPPCQSYSTLGKRQMDDRANLFLQYKRVLTIIRPRAFVFENVVGILSMDHGRLFAKVQKEFEELGYQLKYKVLDAVNYGVPQHRERVILVGFQGDTPEDNPYEYPAVTHGEPDKENRRDTDDVCALGLKSYVTLREALGDLPVIKSGEHKESYAVSLENALEGLSESGQEFLRYIRDNGDELKEHAAPKNGAHLVKIMETLQDGQGKDDLPEAIRPKSGYGNTYAKLWWNRPATTITRNFACPSSSRCIHPRDSRAMSIREGARLQSFPDSYQFYGSDGMKRLEIGNAVPPLLSMAIARQMLEALEK